MQIQVKDQFSLLLSTFWLTAYKKMDFRSWKDILLRITISTYIEIHIINIRILKVKFKLLPLLVTYLHFSCNVDCLKYEIIFERIFGIQVLPVCFHFSFDVILFKSILKSVMNSFIFRHINCVVCWILEYILPFFCLFVSKQLLVYLKQWSKCVICRLDMQNNNSIKMYQNFCSSSY